MKRIGNLFEEFCSLENLRLAAKKARKGKANQVGVKIFDRDPEGNLLKLQQQLLTKAYRTSEYTTFKIFEPKERDIFRLPFFPDRIAHHAAMNVLENIFMTVFTTDTYSSMKKRGIHLAARKLKKALKNVPGTKYCLKLDIKKFYPSVDHEILKTLLRRKIKDREMLWFLDEIIDSAPGLPIGNYLSQFLANFYLTYFDHWLKEVKGVTYYFRYADDLVFLSSDKQSLHSLHSDIKGYLNVILNLKIKSNYQVFPVAARSIDFVGYRFYHTHTLLRKTIKKSFARMLVKRKNKASIASYTGWAKHANTIHLLKKLLHGNKVI